MAMETLRQRIEQLEKQNRELQETVGRWKRKVRGASGNFAYVSERHERSRHYIGVAVTGLPADTPLHEAQVYVREKVLPCYYPYQYWNLYTSRRHGGWVTTLVCPDDTIDMESAPAAE